VVAQDRARQESTLGALEVLAHEDPGGHRLARVIDILVGIAALGTVLFLVGRTFVSGVDSVSSFGAS
jgi:hypothetical protein